LAWLLIDLVAIEKTCGCLIPEINIITRNSRKTIDDTRAPAPRPLMLLIISDVLFICFENWCFLDNIKKLLMQG
jgi:hypothetical protein